jgi:hypothetical protein
MAISVRTLLKCIVGMFPLLLGGAGSSAGREREMLTLSTFIARMRRDPVLRSRFADNPRGVLLAYGIDPSPYDLPDRMTSAQIDRLLAQFAQAPAAPEPPKPPDRSAEPPSASPPPPSPPSVVYGPPPSPQPPAGPPAPVYGPPPGLSK